MKLSALIHRNATETSTEALGQQPVNRFYQPEWIIAQILNFVSVLLVTWVVACVVIYGRKTGKWKRVNARDNKKINAGAVYTSALATMVVSYTALISSQAVFNLGYDDTSSNECEISLDVYVSGYSATIISIYIFLWLRQRSLYKHPTMMSANKRWLAKLSWSSIVVIMAGCLFAGIAYIVPQNYLNSPRGCASKPKREFILWPLYTGNGVVVLGQSLMLFLFIYPLRSQTCQHVTAKRVMRILKRSAGFAVLCVVSDLIAMATLAFIVPESSTRHVTVSVYNASILANLLSVLLSFESWRKILTSPFGRRVPKRTETASSAATSGVDSKTNL